MKRGALWLCLTIALSGCAGPSRTDSASIPDGAVVVTYDESQLVTIRGVVTVPPTTSRDVARVEIRYADNGALAIRMSPDARGVYQTTRLFPDERYLVSAELAMGPDGPWHFPSTVIEASEGGVYRVDLAPYAGDATLSVGADTGTQPYVFALYPGETPAPDGRRQFQEWFEEGRGHRKPLYMRMGAGGDSWSEDRMPSGRYLVVAMANDWTPGDPDALPVWRVIELRPGDVTNLHLGARCTTLDER